MQSSTRRSKQRAFSAVFQRFLPVGVAVLYATVLVLATHYPRPQEILKYSVSDKTLHFYAYFILGISVAVAFLSSIRQSWRSVGGMMIALCAFAALDEMTQPLFKRNAEFLDWIADCGGIVVGVIVVVVTSLVLGLGNQQD